MNTVTSVVNGTDDLENPALDAKLNAFTELILDIVGGFPFTVR